jgi:hypothetical protein
MGRVEAIRPPAWRRWVPTVAAAALLLAAGVGGVRWWLDQRTDGVTRSGGDGQLGLIAPGPDQAVNPGSVSFVWHPATGALRYTIEVLAADGTPAFSASTADTALTAPLGPAVNGGSRWWVRAHLDDGSERRSEPRILHLR